MQKIILMIVVVALVGCGTTSWVSDPSDPNSVKIEKEIRRQISKPTGELTKADLEKVTTLNFRELHQLTDVKGLEKLTNMQRLNLRDNQITDVSVLARLTKLEWLDLSENQITDVSALGRLKKLEWLNISVMRLADGQLKHLAGLKKLEMLALDENPDLTKAQIAELQKALPQCRIISNPTN